jgi:hypothetical protein
VIKGIVVMADDASNAAPLAAAISATAAPRRDIPGNLPYLTASGTLKRVLDRIIEAQRPDKLTVDFLENVLKLTGGLARATIPILKRMGFLTSDGTLTDIYARFKTDSGRGAAALQALRNGFPEIFKRSEYAHLADDNKIRDLIVEITGLKRTDRIVNAIQNTFKVLKAYTGGYTDSASEAGDQPVDDSIPRSDRSGFKDLSDTSAIRLSYNINIVLPETSDLKILNTIFRTLKENLLQ